MSLSVQADHFNPQPEFSTDRIHNTVFPAGISLISPLHDRRKRAASAAGRPDSGKQGNLDPLFHLQDRRKKIRIGRDLHFTYLEPTPSLLLSIGLIILSYTFLSKVFEGLPLSKLFFFGAVIGLSLTLMGMLVVFSRKKRS